MDTYAVYKNSSRCENLIPQIRLRNVEWSVLFSFNEDRSLHAISQMFDLDQEALEPIISKLLDLDLIEECEISSEQYFRNMGTGPDSDKITSVSEFLSQGKVNTSQKNETAPTTDGHSLASVKLPPVPTMPEAEPSKEKRLYLRQLIDKIVTQAPSSTEGQLAVYRVFLRVPPDLLKRNGIVSLSLVEDSTVVTDPELLQALVDAVAQTLKLDIPESMFG